MANVSKPIYHPRYNDPDADMVLQAKDKTRFRVHSYFLKAVSPLFRNMPGEAPLKGQGVKDIEIESDSLSLASLLDLLTSSERPQLPDINHANALIELGKRYHFETLPRLVAPYLYPLIKFGPVGQFVFASQNDMEAHARASIKNAPSLYITVLVRAMRGNEKTGGRIDWHGAASSFEVKR